MTLLRSVVGIVLGYAAMVLLITLVQEVIFGGIGYNESPRWELAVAGLLTIGCAVAGGVVTGVIAGRLPLLHVFPACILVIAETIWLIQTGRADGPLWFDIVAGASLVIGLLIGGAIAKIMKSGIRRVREENAVPVG